MPSRAAGAVKDDVKFDLNKLSKGPPDQPGMAWETKEGEVSIYSLFMFSTPLFFAILMGTTQYIIIYYIYIYILYTVYTHIHYIASKTVFLFSQPMCFTVHPQLLEIR